MNAYDKAIIDYDKGFNNILNQSFDRYEFGSDMEAFMGGSAASFRASDSANYVNRVLTDEPVSWINNNPDEAETIKQIHQLGDDSGAVVGLPDAVGIDNEIDWQKQVGQSVFDSLSPYFLKGSIAALALILVLGGLIIIAFSSETVRDAAKTAAKAAAV